MRRNGSNIEEDIDIDYNIQKSTKRQKSKMIIWLIITIFVYYQIYSLVMYTFGKKDKEKMWLYNSVNSFMGLLVNQKSNQKVEEYTLKFAGLGDVYATTNTLKGAKNGSIYDFTTGTSNLSQKLKEYDLVVASLNTPIALSSQGYSNSNKYNSPDEILDTLKNLNVSALATATYHITDKGEKGISQTIDNIVDKKIEQIGINSQERKDPLVVTKNNITVGILSYATKTSDEILSSKDYLVNVLNKDDLIKDVKYLKNKDVDYIIAYLNINNNSDSKITSSEQKENVELLFDNGVNVVLGTGSSIIQSSEEDQIDLNGEKNHVYAIYSLGDILGGYETEDGKINTIANIEFTKKVTKNKKGQTIKNEKDMVIKNPIGIWTNISTSFKKDIYIINDEMEAYDNNKSDLTNKEYTKLKLAYEKFNSLYK